MNKLDSYLQGLEPVRLRDWLLAVAFPIVGVIIEAVTDWDTQTGWFGLGAGVLVRLTTRPVRQRVTPVAKLDAITTTTLSAGDLKFENEGGSA